MSSTYRPDYWAIIKINGVDPHYRVFGSWSGGYLDGDSWRMNSGITRVEETDDTFKFFGSSGSCYECSKNMYGFNVYGAGIARSYEYKYGKDMFVIFQKMPDVMNIDWVIENTENSPNNTA